MKHTKPLLPPRAPVDSSTSPSFSNSIKVSYDAEASFSNKKLQADASVALTSKMPFLKALDLSHNRIHFIPRGFPATLAALDLSYNQFALISGMNHVRSLIEIKLTHNSIESMDGLSAAPTLQHIDLSYNKIHVIEGIEMLLDLKSLILDHNLIKFLVNIRALTFNKKLLTLKLSDNEVTRSMNYKSELSQLLPNLESLDGCAVLRNRLHTYGDKQSNSGDSRSLNNISVGQTFFAHGSKDNSSPVELDSFDSEDLELSRSSIPWRNPPRVLPRPCTWKGKEVVVGGKDLKEFHYADISSSHESGKNYMQKQAKNKTWMCSESARKKHNKHNRHPLEYEPLKMSLRNSSPITIAQIEMSSQHELNISECDITLPSQFSSSSTPRLSEIHVYDAPKESISTKTKKEQQQVVLNRLLESTEGFASPGILSPITSQDESLLPIAANRGSQKADENLDTEILTNDDDSDCLIIIPNGETIAVAIKELMEKKRKTIEVLRAARKT